MIKRIIALCIALLFVFQGLAFAVETEGDVVFKDALYGTAIGVLLGGAVYLVDQEHFAAKVGIGAAVGTMAGLFYGIAETRGTVEIRKKGSIRINPPVIIVQKRGNDILYSTNLLKIEF